MAAEIHDVEDRDGAAERAMAARLAGARRVLVLARGPSAVGPGVRAGEFDAVVVTDPTYATRDVYAGEPAMVLIGDRSMVLPAVAERWRGTAEERRPMLLFGYLPAVVREGAPDFVGMGLARPLPILPMLARRGLYEGGAGEVYPTSGVLLAMVVAGLGKEAVVAGIDLYRHPTGRLYHAGREEGEAFAWPRRHSEACDLGCLRRAARVGGGRVRFLGVAGEVVEGGS